MDSAETVVAPALAAFLAAPVASSVLVDAGVGVEAAARAAQNASLVAAISALNAATLASSAASSSFSLFSRAFPQSSCSARSFRSSAFIQDVSGARPFSSASLDLSHSSFATFFARGEISEPLDPASDSAGDCSKFKLKHDSPRTGRRASTSVLLCILAVSIVLLSFLTPHSSSHSSFIISSSMKR